MVTKNDFEYNMWNIILISAKKFYGECQNGEYNNQHQCVQKCFKNYENAKTLIFI
jgi:hypothetical protein